jgi:starvation-inducible DNA-binding protein
MEELKQALRVAFATSYAFLLKAQNFHWNVRGYGFLTYHELFGEVYDELEDELDEFAEAMRGLPMDVPASLDELLMYSNITSAKEQLSSQEMVKALYIDNSQVHLDLIDAYRKAEAVNEVAICTTLSERIEEHKKHGWMLYASLST